jgi:ketosteroid isomerase-like protein
VSASANLELVRSMYAAWARGDFSSTDWAHAEIEYVIADGPNPGSWTGVAEMAKTHRGFLRAFTDFRVEAEGFRELEGGRVLVLVRWSGHGRTSGLDFGRMRTTGADIHHVRDGKVTRFVSYYDRDHALADLGLPPEAD